MFENLKGQLRSAPQRWLITGAAGFIGSNLVEVLLNLDQEVVGLDNFATGHQKNLTEVQHAVRPDRWRKFGFIEGDICDLAICQRACQQIDCVLHQAALGSVPRSIADPIRTNESNMTGFLNMLVAARDQKTKRFVYASSSAVYGDHPALPKVEENIGASLSPYAVSKHANELYAAVFARCYGLQTIGLRYFNVFGPRQDPEGAYAAVIPKWIASMLRREPLFINGDGETSRDFCYIENVIQANLLSARAENPAAINQIYNVALNSRTTLNDLFFLIRDRLAQRFPELQNFKPQYREFRSGDVRHSQADIRKAQRLLGYSPTHDLGQGLDAALEWYVRDVEDRERRVES